MWRKETESSTLCGGPTATATTTKDVASCGSFINRDSWLVVKPTNRLPKRKKRKGVVCFRPDVSAGTKGFVVRSVDISREKDAAVHRCECGAEESSMK